MIFASGRYKFLHNEATNSFGIDIITLFVRWIVGGCLRFSEKIKTRNYAMNQGIRWANTKAQRIIQCCYNYGLDTIFKDMFYILPTGVAV
jgi:hypothetical protein